MGESLKRSFERKMHVLIMTCKVFFINACVSNLKLNSIKGVAHHDYVSEKVRRTSGSFYLISVDHLTKG